MSSRRKLLLFPVAGLIAALLWTTLGSFTSASGQTKTNVIARAHAGEFAPSYSQPIFILMLGGDARSGNSTRVRTDSIHIVAIVPGTLQIRDGLNTEQSILTSGLLNRAASALRILCTRLPSSRGNSMRQPRWHR